jgi:hypothetical protein
MINTTTGKVHIIHKYRVKDLDLYRIGICNLLLRLNISFVLISLMGLRLLYNFVRVNDDL